MRAPSRQFVPLAVALTLTSPTWANPFDPGTPGYKQKHIYVDSAFNCQAPSTNCGSQSNPFRKLSEAIAGAQSGDEIIVAGHSNRPYYLEADGISTSTASNQVAWPDLINLSAIGHDPAQRRLLIRAWQGMPKPIIRGTVALNGWMSVSGQANVYTRPWPYVQPDFVDSNTGKTVSNKVMEPEQVFRGANALTQIGGQVFGGYNRDTYAQTPQLIAQGLKDALTNGISDLWPGYTQYVDLDHLSNNQFYFDRSNRVIYVKLDSPLNASERLEVSARQFLLNGMGAVKNAGTGETWGIANVTLQDLVFERSNTSHYWRGGAVLLKGTGLIINRVDFRDSDSHCLQIEGNNNVVSNSTFTRCGQVGLVANGSNNRIQNNYFTLNNARGFDYNWEAGPTKFIGNGGLKNSTISGNVVVNNRGHGIWLDTYNDDNQITDNISAYNQIGIYLENSARATIQKNVVFGNRNQGIQFRGSPGTLVDANVLVGNLQFGVFMHPKSASEAAYPNDGIRVTNNLMAWHEEVGADDPTHPGQKYPPNRAPLWVSGNSTIDANRYCGGDAGGGTLHFWLQDWAPTSSFPYNSFNWATAPDLGGNPVGWRIAKVGNNMSAPAFDTNSSSAMQVVAMPTDVGLWQSQPDMSLVPVNPASGQAARAPLTASATYDLIKTRVLSACTAIRF